MLISFWFVFVGWVGLIIDCWFLEYSFIVVNVEEGCLVFICMLFFFVIIYIMKLYL